MRPPEFKIYNNDLLRRHNFSGMKHLWSLILSALTASGLLVLVGCTDQPDRVADSTSEALTSARAFLTSGAVGFPVEGHPQVASLLIVDLDQDGLLDILVCDVGASRIGWIRQSAAGEYRETWIGPEIKAPARVQPYDLDHDGDLDLLVASMGKLLPSNEKIGSVLILENRGGQDYALHVVAEGIGRVTDVRGGDLDGDGDVDLAVAQFGYHEGETRWMENLGGWEFQSHILQKLSGPIHIIPEDMDQDGDLDLVSLVSQEWEEIYVFQNDGKGHFESHLVFGSTNEDYGSSGMRLVDLDRDGDTDVLFTNGDAFDHLPPRPRPWHAVQWLENTGALGFEYHRIGYFQGAASACAADPDGDGDQDVIAVSAWNLWHEPESRSMIWFVNDGSMNFRALGLASRPSHLIALECEDMNRDGEVDFITAGMHIYPPYQEQARVTLWLNGWNQSTKPNLPIP